MDPLVRLAPAMARHTGGQLEVRVEPGSLHDVIRYLVEQFPTLEPLLVASDGRLQRFLNIYVDDRDLRSLSGLETEIGEGSVVTLLSAVAGG